LRRWMGGLALSGLCLTFARCQPAPKAAPPDLTKSATPLRPLVKVETSLGDFVLQLDAEAAPGTVVNFLDYVAEKYYDGTIFHRVVKETVIQGGAYTPDLKEKTDGLRDGIWNESRNGLRNQKGTIALFRRPLEVNSAQAQFFINVADNPLLDRLRDGFGYTVFGRVVDDMDTVEKIRAIPVGTHAQYAAGLNPVVPKTPIVIQSVQLISPFDRELAAKKAWERRDFEENRVDYVVRDLEKEAGMTAQSTENGVRYVDLRVGTGAFPVEEGTVVMYYQGTLLNGVEFDSTAMQGREKTNIEVKKLIRGLREGIMTMREGGVRKMVMPAELGYGAMGVPGKIPAGSPLVFQVELFEAK